MPIERQETYLVIHDRETMRVVTVIEILSPANKRSKGDGRQEYMIPIPLKPGDADASVSLQEVFEIVYHRARYDLSVKYDAKLDPPLTPDELRWVQSSSNQS